MAEVTRRRSGELVRGVFKLLLAHPEGLPEKSILENLAYMVPPTEFEKITYIGAAQTSAATRRS